LVTAVAGVIPAMTEDAILAMPYARALQYEVIHYQRLGVPVSIGSEIDELAEIKRELRRHAQN
jgi:hypothetical protein